MWDARVMAPSRRGDPYYVFLCVKHLPDIADGDYRKTRAQLLSNYCHVVKLEWRDANVILGIATESGLAEARSEDLAYLDTSNWDAESEAHAVEIQRQFSLLKKRKLTRGVEHEYPVDHMGKSREGLPSRNSKCKCGSGKRFRHCHGRTFFPKKR
jgi:hypothetical protein